MRLALIGGRSRSGRAFARHVAHYHADVSLRIFSRSRAGTTGEANAEEIVVTDYNRIDSALLAGCDAVIDFVGTARSRGLGELRTINVEVAARLAQAAKIAGAQQFVYLSSLSVHPPVPIVDADTPVAPHSNYGISKAEAEKVLASLATRDFVVTVVRTPTIYGPEAPSKMARLARLYQRLPAFPVPRWQPQRSIISHGNLARVLFGLVGERRGGIVYAADPEPFTFEMLARVYPRTRLLSVSALVLNPLRIAAPTLYRSLYESMEISPALLYRPPGEPLTTTARALAEALARDDPDS